MSQMPLLGAITLLVALTPIKLFAGSKVSVGSNVPTAQQIPIDHISHAAWDALLRKYCDPQGYVNYQGWHDSPADLQELDQYLAHVSRANLKLPASTANKFAFWINAYNAVTIKGILREYPTSSIQNHQSKTFGYKIWDDLLLPVDGRTYSLNQIEHDVLRKMGDPRIHFALVCASVGCPPLLNQAYTAEQLDSQLTDNARKFFADPQKFQATADSLKISKLFKWYGGDFGSDQAAQLRALAPFMPTQQSRALAASGRARLGYLPYSWNLNDQATKSGGASR